METKIKSFQEQVDAFKRSLLTKYLIQNNGNIAQTAKALKTSRTIVAYNIKRLGIKFDFY